MPPGTPHGYLAPSALPDSLALLPPPPEPGSAAFARDEAASTAGAQPPGSARFVQATSDADLHFPHAAHDFADAVQAPIGEQATPRLYLLLERSLIDIGLSTYAAKDHYRRVRPFVLHHNASCTPNEEKFLRGDGSYPSGHSAAGWGWALLLSELVPDRADAILARGIDFGQSRITCNVHWQSDVDAGRIMAAATVARLHADPAFIADMAAAKKEIEALRGRGVADVH